MLTSPDFRELLSLLAKHKVRYLVVGGYAVMKYTEPPRSKYHTNRSATFFDPVMHHMILPAYIQ